MTYSILASFYKGKSNDQASHYMWKVLTALIAVCFWRIKYSIKSGLYLYKKSLVAYFKFSQFKNRTPRGKYIFKEINFKFQFFQISRFQINLNKSTLLNCVQVMEDLCWASLLLPFAFARAPGEVPVPAVRFQVPVLGPDSAPGTDTHKELQGVTQKCGWTEPLTGDKRLNLTLLTWNVVA